MENSAPSLSTSEVSSEDKSLETFKQNVLNESDLGDSFSTISPDSSVVRSEYDDDHLEGIFYKTKRDVSCITVNFVSSAFYTAFQDKILSDYSSSIDCDEANRIYRCSTHVRSLKCEMKLDGKSKNVTVTGVGRIMWRKDYYPRIAKIIFKQYVQKSESQLGGSLIDSSQCDILTAEKVEENPLAEKVEENSKSVNTVQVVFSSTPLISRKTNQTINSDNPMQPPCTPIVPQAEQQTALRQTLQNASTDVMATGQGNEAQATYGDQQPICADADADAQFNAVPGYNQTNTGHYACTNVGSDFATGQPIYMPEFGQVNNGGIYFNENETVSDGNGVIVTQNAPPTFMMNAPPMFTMNAPPMFTMNTQPMFTMNAHTGQQNYMDCASNMQPLYSTIQMADSPLNTVTQHMVSRDIDNGHQPPSTSDVTSQTISTMIEKIKRLETQVNDMKSSIIFSMESRIDEMKSSLVRLIDNMASKSYSEPVQKRPASNHCISLDEGYENTSVEGTATDTSQTLLKTVYTQQTPSTTRNTTTSTTRNTTTPTREIPVRVTHRDSIGNKANVEKSQPAPNINSVSTNKNNNTTVKKTLIIGDSILHPINPKGMVAGIQKHSHSGAKVRDIIDDITLYNLKSFRSVILYIGGNDSSSGTDVDFFQESYDELVSLVKTSNPDCHLYVCCIAPRADTDVSLYNACIRRVADHWANNNVSLIDESTKFFTGRDGVPPTRYYAHDGIHLSNSGIKRLLHAMDSHSHLVEDFDKCVFTPHRRNNAGNSMPGRFQRSSGHSQAGNRQYAGMRHRNGPNRNEYGRRRCFACGMTGHIIRDCLNK